MNNKLKIAAFGAHPDDIEFLMGGTIAKYKEQGHDVYTFIATDGRRGRANLPDLTDKQVVELRMKEALSAGSHIGIEPVFLGFEDGRLVYNAQTYEKFALIMEKMRPDVVFAPDLNDYHSDHRVTAKLVLDTFFWVPALFFADSVMGVGFEPQYYVDITAQFEIKLKMFCEHESQGAVKHSHYLKLQSEFRAAQCFKNDIKYAEAFRGYAKIGQVDGYKLLP